MGRGAGRARKINKANTDFDSEDFPWFSDAETYRRNQHGERNKGPKGKPVDKSKKSFDKNLKSVPQNNNEDPVTVETDSATPISEEVPSTCGESSMNCFDNSVETQEEESRLDALKSSKPPSLEHVLNPNPKSAQTTLPQIKASLQNTTNQHNTARNDAMDTSSCNVGTAPETLKVQQPQQNYVSELQSISRDLHKEASGLSLESNSSSSQQGILSYSDSVDPNKQFNLSDFPPLGMAPAMPNIVSDWKQSKRDLSNLSGGRGRGRSNKSIPKPEKRGNLDAPPGFNSM